MANFIKRKDAQHRGKSSLSYILCTRGAMYITVGILVYIIGFVLVRGIPHLTGSLFAWNYNTENVSMLPAILSTLIVVFFAIMLAGPIGIFTGIYLVEYARPGSKFVEVIRVVTETLAGIPSIIYGLFGYLFFNIALQFSYSLLSGICTVSIMVLPPIVRATEEALLSVNNGFRLGSYALGAGRLQTIFKIILPAAIPGILSGIILAIGRIVGETAALVFTLGTSTNIPHSLKQSGITLSLHMYKLSSEGKFPGQAYATGVILLVIVFILNHMSGVLAKKLGGNHGKQS
ncbi:MAG: phosphate ABC transporter permease PstA [Tissierellia bacterium]|nr:phosphate ABC transporter permease PstA [Tissierellia bacterium]